MYHSFLIHLSADGHPGCFHVLAIVNSAAVNNEIHVSKEQQLCFAGAAMKGYPMPKVRETQVRWKVLQEVIRGQTH